MLAGYVAHTRHAFHADPPRLEWIGPTGLVDPSRGPGVRLPGPPARLDLDDVLVVGSSLAGSHRICFAPAGADGRLVIVDPSVSASWPADPRLLRADARESLTMFHDSDRRTSIHRRSPRTRPGRPTCQRCVCPVSHTCTIHRCSVASKRSAADAVLWGERSDRHGLRSRDVSCDPERRGPEGGHRCSRAARAPSLSMTSAESRLR
jgi:hypothetical protein